MNPVTISFEHPETSYSYGVVVDTCELEAGKLHLHPFSNAPKVDDSAWPRVELELNPRDLQAPCVVASFRGQHIPFKNVEDAIPWTLLQLCRHIPAFPEWLTARGLDTLIRAAFEESPVPYELATAPEPAEALVAA